MSLLLQDKIFISTRPKGQSDELAQLFSKAGATFIELPMIKIQAFVLSETEKEILRNLKQFRWIVFTSPNGVVYFFKNLEKLQGNKNLPETVKLAVVGKKTERVLINYGCEASFVNPGSTGEDFAESFAKHIRNEKQKPAVLLALGNLARNVIPDHLKEYADCTRINFYETVDAETPDNEIMKLISENKYEMLLFTSPSGINNFLKMTGNIQPEKIKAACIGVTTSNAALKNNITPLVVAKNSTSQGLFESVTDYYKK